MTEEKKEGLDIQQLIERLAAMRHATNVEDLFKAGMSPRRIREDAMPEFGNYLARYAFELTTACGHLLNTLDGVYEAAGIVASLAEEFCKKAHESSEDVPIPPNLKQ